MYRGHGPYSIEAEQLLPMQGGMSEMADLSPQRESLSRTETGLTMEEEHHAELSSPNSAELPMMAREANGGQVVNRVYKRRWFGLTQLVLLNIVVSWDVRGIFSQCSPNIIFSTERHWLTLIPSGCPSPL